MTSQHIQFLLWHTRRLLDELGVVGVIGVGLLAFCAMYYFSSYRVAVRETQSLQQKREAGNKTSAASSRIQSPEIQLQAFYDSFPKSSAAPDAIARINEVALANGLMLEQGEYSVVRKEGDKLAQYGVVLPLKGDYIHLRKFIFQSRRL